MTQHSEAVEQQREILELEKQAKQIVDYADGRRVTEYRDKRKTKVVENRYGEDVE